MLTFNIGYQHPKQHIQFLIILPPINSIFLFLFSLTWIERRFRLSYIPLICLFILLFSSLTLTIISSLFLTSSIVLYFNLIFHCFSTLIYLILLILLITSYVYGWLDAHDQSLRTTKSSQFDKFILKSNEHELVLYMSRFPCGRQSHDIQTMLDDLNRLHINIILTLNETKEVSFINLSSTHNHMGVHSTRIQRTSMEHIIYPIRKSFIPKSISDYIQFLYSIVNNVKQHERECLLVHCMNGLGRTGMTIVCLELVYEYMMNENQHEKEQKFFERICHYPFLLQNFCRVCQAITNVRRIRPKSIHNPIQILFVHEFYARLKSLSYMQQIKEVIHLNDKVHFSNFEELHLPIDT
ncbi:unnamed protein product [Adineta ricciae]|uniref:Tyrosine specific protein phosphatases domain-containing protein n=1 Tax=Adineta ricciae TaxID=249248 RepID=A0A814TP21_ADIRI|nr:unnamed protein product [Adineta ricciae]CAF1160711.1 unnamed protein product [Adineta ricciae]